MPLSRPAALATFACALLLGCGGDVAAPPILEAPSGATSQRSQASPDIQVSWTDNSSEESAFQIERSTAGLGGPFAPLGSVSADATLYDDGAVDGVSQYCYRVRAVGMGATDFSPYSNTTCYQFPAPVSPLAPSALSATAASPTRIDLAWTDNADDETGFEVWRSTTGSTGTYSLLDTVDPDAITSADTGLDPETEYCYEVRATGTGVPPSEFSASDCATTPAPPPPAKPTALVATATSTSAIDLVWVDHATDETGFEIWRSTTGPSGTFTSLSTAAADAESGSDTGLDPETQYCYEVRAIGGGSAPPSDFSNISCDTTLTPVTVRIVLFGDSNTDRCEEDQPNAVSSYVSVSPNLAPNDPPLACSTPGKVRAKWQALRPSNPIVVVNHAIASTTTGGLGGTGDPVRSSNGSPNARTSVSGTTRFEAEVLGEAAPGWNGGEPTNAKYPNGPITRVNAFTPGQHDFAYVSMGTNDDAGATRTLTAAQTEANLRYMAQHWIDAGHAASHFIITTLAPRDDANSATSIPDRNTRIRSLADELGLHLIDLSDHVSDDNGATWRSTALNIGDGIHYVVAVRGWIGDQVVSWMDGQTP